MKFFRNHLYFICILISGIFLRLQYLFTQSGNLSFPNLGGDPCHHYNTAVNVSKNFLPQNDFIFSYWFRHESIPALIDLYPPGFYYALGAFLFIFGNEYIFARIFNFLIGLINILFAYLIGCRIKSRNTGLISSIIVTLNIFHIENSTVVMSVVFAMFMIQLCFLLFLLTKKNILYWFFLGISCGYSFLTLGATLVLFICFIFYIFYKFLYKEYNIKYFFLIHFLFLIGLIIIVLPWGIITNNYFGTPFYSNLNFYPFTDSFSTMMHETQPPSFLFYVENNELKEIIYNYFLWSMNGLYKGSLYLTPTIFFPFAIFFIPLILFNSFKSTHEINLFLLILILLFFISIIGSTAISGILFPRHFVPFLSISSILLALGIVNFYHYVSKYSFFIRLSAINNFFINLVSIKYYFFVLIIIFIAMTSLGLYVKEEFIHKSFWNRNALPYYEFGNWIKENTNKESVIMYGLTPQDAWCATNRKIVGDPTFRLSNDPKRALEEVLYYNVDYLWIDLSNNIYTREENIDEIINLYEKLNLELIKFDAKNQYFFYKINK